MHNFTDETDPFFVVEHFGYEIPALMGEMMERGYIVTGTEGNVTLMKMATDSDPKTLINPDLTASDRTRIGGLQTRMHALAKYLLIRDLPEAHAPKMTTWACQMLYQVGRDVKIVNLEQVQSITYEEAKDLARVQADAYIEARPELHKFGYKEVKVRPA